MVGEDGEVAFGEECELAARDLGVQLAGLRRCGAAPVAIAIDDLQWADQSTLLLLHRLACSINELPVVLVCAWRPVPHRRELRRLEERLVALGATPITLGPLQAPEIGELLRNLTGHEPGPNLLRLASGSAGNPLFAMELVGALQREGTLEHDGHGQVEAVSSSLPPSLPVAILHRLSYLSDDALRTLRLAAVLGSRLELSDLCLLLGRSAASLVAVLDEVVVAGVLDADGDRFAFRHDLIREALYFDLPRPVRAQLHRDAARAMAKAGALVERVAEHAARGAAPGDRFAVNWLRRAAGEAVDHAPAVAVDWLDRALELLGPDDPQAGPLLADRAMSLLWSGRIADAEEACRSVLASPVDPSLYRRVQLCLAQVLFARGRGHEAVQAAELAAMSPGITDADRAQVRAWASLGHMATGHLDQAVEAAEQACSTPAADEVARSVALTTMATATSFAGRLREAIELQERAIATADASRGRAAHRFPLQFFQGMFLSEVDDLEGAQQALARGRRVSEEIGALWNLPLYAWASAWVRLVAGAWDDALAECEASLALADELGTRHGVVLVHSVQSMIFLHRGELKRATQALAAANREFAATGPQHGLENVMAWARALLIDAGGDTPGAAGVLADAWDQLSEAGIAGYGVDLGPDLVRMALLIGERDRAQAATVALEELAAINDGLARTSGCALLCRGLVAASPTLLVEAADTLIGGARPLDAARACSEAAAALGAGGNREGARQHFERALARFEDLGARRAIAQTEARMRALGLRRGSKAARARPRTGWDSLTPTERAVADLATDGLTNPQIAQRLFVSRHTVHTHVAHILAKLALRSRVQLAAEVALRRGEDLRQDAQQREPADEGSRGVALDRHPS